MDERQKEEEKLPLIEIRVVHVTGELQVIVLFWKGNRLSLRCMSSDIMITRAK